MAKSRVLQNIENHINQGFGNGHDGVDLAWDTDPNEPVIAHSPGLVTFLQTGYTNAPGSSGNASYGNCVKLEHPNGYATLYAHLETVTVSLGQEVEKGQLLGLMGNTGNSYGNHLHFELHDPQGIKIDPAPYLEADLPNLPTKEEEEMTPEQVRDIARQELEQRNPTYQTLEQIPDYWREDIRALIELGVIRGDAKNPDGTISQLGLTRSEVKAAVIAKRLFDLAAHKS